MIGTMAGMMSKSGVVGYIGSFPIPEVVMGINAFTLAAQKINPAIQTKVVWVNSWHDPGKEGDAAKTLIDQGADIITQHTDSAAPAAAGRAARPVRLRPGRRPERLRAQGPAHRDHRQLEPLLHRAHPGRARRHLAVAEHLARPEGGHGRDRALRPVGPARGRGRRRHGHATRSSPARCHPFTGPIIDEAGTERVGTGLTIPDADLAKMDWYVKGVQA